MRPRRSVWSVPHRLGTFITQRLCTFIMQAVGRRGHSAPARAQEGTGTACPPLNRGDVRDGGWAQSKGGLKGSRGSAEPGLRRPQEPTASSSGSCLAHPGLWALVKPLEFC